MGWEIGQEIIDKLRFKKRTYGHSVPVNHAKYGKIYYPNYNLDMEFFPGDSDLYNEYGEKLETFFIRDDVNAHNPYRQSRYFMWDRYNFGLKTHFYTHKHMLEKMGNPDRRFGMLVESEALFKSSYDLLFKHKGLHKDFDLIFTHSARILDNFDNARFVPFGAAVWVKDIMSDDLYKRKTKNVSILCSNKVMCPMHKFRNNIAFLCKNEGLADTFGTFDGGKRADLSDVLLNYRYSICIENDIRPYYFTEKLLNAIATQTIPVYLGAAKIDQFFNPDGIIKITTKDDIKQVLKQCTEEEYNNRLSAILDNYKRVLQYNNSMDYIYEKFLRQ